MILIYTFTHPKTFTPGHVSVNEKKLKLSHENVKKHYLHGKQGKCKKHI